MFKGGCLVSTDDILECLDDIQWYLDRGEVVGIESIVNELRREIVDSDDRTRTGSRV